MRPQGFQASNISTAASRRSLRRLLVVLLCLVGTAVWASPPAGSAVVDPASRTPRTSLVDPSAMVPDVAPRPPRDARDGATRPSAGGPAGSHWAVVIGADTYQGATADTIGSVADARLLTDLLDRHGWRDDHVRTLTGAEATEVTIRQAFAWLARKSDSDSTVVVSFSGHMDRRRTADGAVTGLWTRDDGRIWRGDLARMLGEVDAERMWVSLQGCYAGGLAAPGVEGDDRLVTYSSRASQASYEDPRAGHSVMGNYLFREGLAQGWGNGGDPQGVSVQGAFEWAVPRAHRRTGGRQTPLVSDGLGEPFILEVAPIPN